MRDPYKVLGVKRDAGADEIKAAWRNLAKAVHPDHNQNDPKATERFAEIGRAYDLLKDPRKRDLFDTALRSAQAKKESKASKEKSDGKGPTIMEQREAAREAAARAKAAQANAEKLMEELARAAAQKAAAEAAKTQQTGTSEAAEEAVEQIFATQGRASGPGPRPQPQQPAADGGEDEIKREDERAEGAGAAASGLLMPLQLLTSLVRRLTGQGQAAPDKAPDEIATAVVTIEDILKSKWMTVTLPEGRDIGFALPAGTTDGDQVRLKGQGFKLPGMQRGDAVVNIRVAPDPQFRVEGHDLYMVLPVNIANAVLGAELRVEGPRGPLTVTVPAWSGSDKTIRIANQGLARDDGSKGDLVVELRIILWEKPDEKVTDLMKSMRDGLFL
jgi:DnaJ-class molecular chaperone